MFGHKGPCLFTESKSELLRLMAFLNTDTATGLVHALGVGRVEIQSYEVGTIQGIPVPPLDPLLEQLAETGFHLTRSFDTVREVTHAFTGPATLSLGKGLIEILSAYTARESDIRLQLADVRAECERLVIAAYGLQHSDVESLKKLPGVSAAKSSPDSDDVELPKSAFDPASGVVSLLSWLFGVVFGRWDVRITIDPSLAPKLPAPFEPLPVCPPGMLVGPDGLPAESNHIASEEWLCARPDANTLPPEGLVKNPTIPDSEYPIRISWDGILVDDPGFDNTQPHGDDIVRRVREVLDLLWKDKAHEIEQEGCDILGVSELRDYFRKPTSFFSDHIKRYSKSRRKAPIYWQLATPTGSYAVWLYYHRFTKDTFYKVLNDYVNPKLQEEERRLTNLRQDAGPNPTAGQRKEIAAQETFVEELRTFRDEVARIAPLWNPDLNDGVIINFAPLWRLVPQHRPWQKECTDCWDKLVKGEYDWAHLAMHLWPERVVPKCTADRSLAIAHGLEEALWVEGEDGKWRPKDVPPEELQALIGDWTSPTVKAALAELLAAPKPSSRTGGRKPTAKRRPARA